MHVLLGHLERSLLNTCQCFVKLIEGAAGVVCLPMCLLHMVFSMFAFAASHTARDIHHAGHGQDQETLPEVSAGIGSR